MGLRFKNMGSSSIACKGQNSLEGESLWINDEYFNRPYVILTAAY